MCLIVFALESHPRYRLVLAANRDEYFRRPTRPAGFWEDAPQILAGRDLDGNGTWLGVTTRGKIAAITNYRDPHAFDATRPSRGRLVSGFLTGDAPPENFAEMLDREGADYNGFNLIFGDLNRIWYHSNREGHPRPVPPGIHGLSNHLLDTPWPKVVTARDRLARLLATVDFSAEELLTLLADTAPFPDHLLPHTGIGRDGERLLSPLFITGSTYGTRSTTVILAERNGPITFLERSFDDRHRITGTVAFSLRPGGITATAPPDNTHSSA